MGKAKWKMGKRVLSTKSFKEKEKGSGEGGLLDLSGLLEKELL